jgi:CheY-like chemotaxis protein
LAAHVSSNRRSRYLFAHALSGTHRHLPWDTSPPEAPHHSIIAPARGRDCDASRQRVPLLALARLVCRGVATAFRDEVDRAAAPRRVDSGLPPDQFRGRLQEMSLNRPIALVVDDEPLIRMNLSDILESEGYELLEAGSAPEAEMLLKARGDVSLLITDVKMPGSFDGLDLAERVASGRPQVKIVLVSGHAHCDDARLPPCAQFIRKPYTVAGILARARLAFARVEIAMSRRARCQRHVHAPPPPSLAHWTIRIHPFRPDRWGYGAEGAAPSARRIGDPRSTQHWPAVPSTRRR